MATIERFLRSGHLGPVVLGMTPVDVTNVLGEPEGTTKKKNPLQIKYGAAQLSFWSASDSIYQLREIAIFYQPVSEELPEPIKFTDWQPKEPPTQLQFVQFIDSIGLAPAGTSENADQIQFVFASGVIALCVGGMLHVVRLLQRQTKEVDSIQLSGHREASPQQILEMLEESNQAMRSNAQRAALLMAWAGLEAALRRTAVLSGFAGKLRAQPSILMRELFAAGRLTDTELETLEKLRQTRTGIAHGSLESVRNIEEQIFAIQRLAKKLLGSSVSRRVMIKCPNTGKPVFTGMATDERSWMNPMNQWTNNHVQCPHCGQIHTWSKGDAFLAD